MILITLPEFRKASAVYRASGQEILLVEPDEKSFLDAIHQTRASHAIVGMVRYSEAVYRALGENASVRGEESALLCRFGVGMDSVNREFARKWNVRLANTPGVLNRSVAEHTFWLLGAAAKRLGSANASVRDGSFAPQTGMELFGKHLLLVGFGGIARETARIAHFGFGMRVTAFARHEPDPEVLKRYGVERFTIKLEPVLPEADAVCVLLASTPETFHFFDASRFALMRPDVLFVNTARGALVDENALFDFLTANPSAFAALDVFETEPYTPQDPARDLRLLQNTFFTAHHGSSTREANEAIARATLEHFSQ